MKKILSIFLISALLFLSNLSFAQTSDETILVQLNNLKIREIQQNPEEGVLAKFVVEKLAGFRCRYFQSEESTISRPCSLRLRREVLRALRQGLKVHIYEDTELLGLNREAITLQNFQVGDRINVYGELNRNTTYEVDALIVRKIGTIPTITPTTTTTTTPPQVPLVGSTSTTTPSITVISPNGGEVWVAGKTYTVSWRSLNAPSDAWVGKIRMYKGSTFLYGLVPEIYKYPPTGSIEFSIPLGHVTGNDFKIQVILYTGEYGSETEIAQDFSDAPFTIVEPITLLSPNGGEIWEIGRTYEIRWTNTTGKEVFIELVRSTTGVSYPITSAGPTETSIAWTIPSTIQPANDYKIRIKTTDGTAIDTSDYPFSIVLTPSITVISPNGGEVWEIGKTYEIKWVARGVHDKPVVIYLTDEKGVFQTRKCFFGNKVFEIGGNGLEIIECSIAMSAFGTEVNGYRWSWNVKNYPPSDRYRVHIVSLTPDTLAATAAQDMSDYPFSIVSSTAPSVRVISPNGGNKWITGKTYDIKWQAQGVGEVVIELIDYSCSSEISKTIATNIPASRGSYSWKVPSDFFQSQANVYCVTHYGWRPGDNFKIFIAELKPNGTYGVQDESDNYFTIVEPGVTSFYHRSFSQ
jgi:hypothetical protein